MNNKDLFKVLLKAHYENRLEETVSDLLQENPEEKELLAKIIAPLCGIELDYSEDFASELKNKISYHTCEYKIVTKIKSCSMECAAPGEKTSCQKACPFEAINIDEENHTTYINNEKCVDCGFCIEACSNNNFIDKVEFLPLAKLL